MDERTAPVRTPHRAEELPLLRARARELAAPEEVAAETAEPLEIVEFTVGSERLAFESRLVREALLVTELVPVPGTPAFVAGVVTVRGRIVSAVDLRGLLGLGGGTPEEVRALVLTDGQMEFAVLTDSEAEVSTRRIDELQAFPGAAASGRLPYLKGVLPGPVSLLDAPLLLSDGRMSIEESC